ncbi:NADP-dependent oxidoreductase [Lentilactobacillus sp. SPB1-3]|uniref:NADP-dependent oxidoreductase n=1 Tax=Lentilactobacillus terminaliae TaxID=3003483 RepID=A0ACD5DEM8_9LACO|nr:NADP-dependent oxidoreductase [Lentilactobacillus sp. SPB1-3]
MKAAQIKKYSKTINVQINNIDKPEPISNEVLIKVSYAAVNPLDIMNVHGSVRLMQNYSMPLTLGNEVSGVITEIGNEVNNFKIGDKVYARLPLDKIGGFAEYVAVRASEISNIPNNLTLKQAVAVPLTGLTAYQGLVEELQVKPHKTLFIPGGSGSFGQLAVPVAKSMGLQVIVSGNARMKDHILKLGADQYIDYRKDDYWDLLKDIDYVIDTRGGSELDREMSIMKPGGRILSLIAGPNRQFAVSNNLAAWKTILFGVVGRKLDKIARKHQVEYRFIFVRSNGQQLEKITEIVEKNNIIPQIDSHEFSLDQIQSALE